MKCNAIYFFNRASMILCNMYMQGRKQVENLGATAPMVGRIYPSGWNRVKVSENFGVTPVAPVAPVDTYLLIDLDFEYLDQLYFSQLLMFIFCVTLIRIGRLIRNSKSIKFACFICGFFAAII